MNVCSVMHSPGTEKVGPTLCWWQPAVRARFTTDPVMGWGWGAGDDAPALARVSLEMDVNDRWQMLRMSSAVDW